MANMNRNIRMTIVTGLKGKGIDEAIKDTKRLGKQLNSLSNTVIKASAAFAAFTASRKLVEFGGAAVDEARDLTRNVNGLTSVFGAVSPQMLEFSRNAADMGLSMNQAAKASTFIGSVLKQSGFSIQETADLTERLVGLGTDLAITYGYDVQEALLGMTALFRGEYDPIEKFGVAMKQNEINAELARREQDNLTGSARRLAEQTIRVEFLFERASDALGQYAKQSGTLFAAQQQLRATFENMQAVVGYALTPALAELTTELRPLVEQLVPVLIAIFKEVIPVVKSLTQNKEALIGVIIGVAEVVLTVTKLVAGLTKFLVDNAEAVKAVVITLGTLFAAIKVWQLMAQGIMLANSALRFFNISLLTSAKAIRNVKLAIASTGFGLIAVGIGFIASKIMEATDGIDEDLADLEAGLREFDFEAYEAEALGATEQLKEFEDGLNSAGAAAGEAKDTVGDFFRSLGDDAAKLSARLELEALGATEGLISKILGSGEEWYKVFEEVTRDGMASVERVQAMFLQTATGFDEAMDKWQQEFDAFKEFEKSALEARDALVEFVREFEVLPSIAAEIGTFEQDTVRKLENLEERLKDAFDNGQLLEDSYRNLLQYARDEFNVLRDIERQRDQLLARRDAAAALISQVQSNIRSSANIVNILRDVQDEAQGVDVVEFANRTVSAGTSLKEFRTALLYNFVEPIEQAQSQADKLVQGYRAVVDRTREFVENLKTLRALGLDPMLFNQLVEAGVEAGGATAQALVEGGADTITEVNGLFAELDALGQELGENTAQVMYGQGENFVDGIVNGLESQLGELEAMANSLAESFTTTFEEVLIAGIESAIAAAEAALARMPQAPGFDYTPPGVTSDDGNGIQVGEIKQEFTGPAKVLAPTALNQGLQMQALSSQFAPGGRFGVSVPTTAPTRTTVPSYVTSPTPAGAAGRIINVFATNTVRAFQNLATTSNSRSGSNTSGQSWGTFNYGVR